MSFCCLLIHNVIANGIINGVIVIKWIVGQKAASASNPEYFDNGNGKTRQSKPAQPRESDYYNNDFGHQPPKRNDSAAAAKSKRSLVNESAV